MVAAKQEADFAYTHGNYQKAAVGYAEIIDRAPGDWQVEARYGTPRNFTGEPLPGYEANRIYLRREAAEALARVQKRLMSGGMGLKVFDGYRPVRATLSMVDWAKRTDNTS